MDKRSALEVARLALESVTTHHEVPSDHPLRTEAKREGYHYLRIAVTNMETDITLSFYTIRPHDGYGPFINDLVALAKWPGELLEKLAVQVARGEIGIEHMSNHVDETPMETTPIYSPFSSETEHYSGTHNARHIADKQLHGGRKKSGISPQTEKAYRDLASIYHKLARIEPDITQREFCKRYGVNRSKLTRALKYVSKNAP